MQGLPCCAALLLDRLVELQCASELAVTTRDMNTLVLASNAEYALNIEAIRDPVDQLCVLSTESS